MRREKIEPCRPLRGKGKHFWIMLALLVFIPGLATEVRAADLIYVQSLKATLLAQPELGAAKITEVVKGTAMHVLQEQNGWYLVRSAGQEGWVSRYLVRRSPPRGKISLLSTDENNLATGARRRASSFTTAAAARGLKEDRRRQGGGYWTEDMAPVKKMEELKIPLKEVLDFNKGVHQ